MPTTVSGIKCPRCGGALLVEDMSVGWGEDNDISCLNCGFRHHDGAMPQAEADEEDWQRRIGGNRKRGPVHGQGKKRIKL